MSAQGRPEGEYRSAEREGASMRTAVAQRRARATDRQRLQLLGRIERWLELPMMVLGFVWLALLVVELVHGLGPILEALGTVIWILFIADFLLAFVLAPDKLAYLKTNWLTALSLLAPALRIFRVFRVARALRAARVARGLRLFRLVASVNRGLGSLGAHMSRRGIGYVLALTLLVLVAGSAGIYAFEGAAAGDGGLDSYGAALWWTAMLLTTLGSDYWPLSAEGRVLCLLIAAYAFAVFGYVTAALASFFVGREARDDAGDLAGARQIERLADEVAALRRELRALQPAPPGSPPAAG